MKPYIEIYRGADGALLASVPGHSLVSADLSGKDLRGADLRNRRLSGANMQGCDLRDADLHNAALCHTDLTGADLRGVDLSDADLSNATLSGADLREAVFDGAYLPAATLQGARLEGASFVRANLEDAILVDCDLRLAQLYRANITGVRGLLSAEIGGYTAYAWRHEGMLWLRYGCEELPLSEWRERVVELCDQHEYRRSAAFERILKYLFDLTEAWAEIDCGLATPTQTPGKPRAGNTSES